MAERRRDKKLDPLKRRRPRPPVRVTAEILDDCFEALAAGMTLSEFCAQPGRPNRRSIVRVIEDDPVFCERFQRAREHGYDVIAEDILKIVDADVPTDEDGRIDGGVIQQRKLQADVRLRLLSKWCTARYGEKMQLAGDPDKPLLSMSDSEIWAEIMGMLATAKTRQMRDPENRLSGSHEKLN